MTDRLVCAVDCTPSSRGAVCAAIATAEALGMRVVLVHVAEPDGESHEELVGRASTALERLLAGLPLPDDAVRRVEVGDPADQVIAAAADEEAALVLTGTRSSGGRAKALFGSVASEIVERSPVPVVAVPEACCDSALGGEPPVARSVIVGIDGAERGREAARVAGAFARRARAEVVLAHVVQPVSAAAAPPVGVVPPVLPPEDDAPDGLGRRALEEARELVPDPEDVELVLLHGLPGPALEELARERSADLIVLGSSRPGRFKRLLFGSTADRLAESSKRLLMIVPQDHARRATRPDELQAAR